MGRKKTPSAKAKLTGADKVHPERYRGEAPVNPDPVGPAPKHLGPQAKKAWAEIRDNCAAGVLTAAESISLEMAAQLVAEFRNSPSDFPSSKMTNLRGILASFGMTPSDRQKLAVDKGDADDGWKNI